MDAIVGIDLGGTRIKGAIFDAADGRLLAKDTVPTRDGEILGNEPAFVSGARDLVVALESAAGVKAARAGLSAPGLANRAATAIDFMPGRLDGLEKRVWSGVFGKPCTVLNDAHAALLGEIWQGSARGLRDAVFLTLGTGVGGAAVCDGRLLRGHLGRAGHLGHISLDYRAAGDICGTPGSLEDCIGNHNIGVRSGGRFTSTHALLEAVVVGDAAARTLWDESLRALAAGIVSLINAFDPEAVLIGGGVAEAWHLIEPGLSRWMDRFEWRPGGHRVEIRKAALGEWAGVYGAARAATGAGAD